MYNGGIYKYRVLTIVLISLSIFIMMVVSFKMNNVNTKDFYIDNGQVIISNIKKFIPSGRNNIKFDDLESTNSNEVEISYTYTKDGNAYRYDGITDVINMEDINNDELSYAIKDRINMGENDRELTPASIMLLIISGTCFFIATIFLVAE